MYGPTYMYDFQDPLGGMEMPLYNGFILSLFVLICGGLFMPIACSNPFMKESAVDLDDFMSEMGIFISTSLVVISLCIPGLMILYTQNPDKGSNYVFPVTAYQWYWSLGWSGNEIEMNLNRSMSSYGATYLLETGDCGVIPLGMTTTFYITSNDVLHAFSLPSVFMKCDAVPGRLNTMMSDFVHPGVMYGQCSELCGVGHSYMPIKLEVLNSYAK
uniref:cytochrome-c oxidase n=1 Tax=Ihlea magalhanica TaxID=2781116 RepID=A0AA86IMU9_9UROC|nr:cytochrome c oxidase subunit II [Ihlea magalhanica]